MANNTISQVEINNETYDILDANVSLRIYPVGSIYMSVDSTSPSTLFGGTWESIQDRFLLAAGNSFGAGTTGGEVNHALTPDETATKNHSHSLNGHTHSTYIGKHSHSIWTNETDIYKRMLANGVTLTWMAGRGGGGSSGIGPGSDNTLKISIPSLSGGTSEVDYGWKTSGGPSNDSTGGLTAANGSAHNNMPPYLAVYVWKRTA